MPLAEALRCVPTIGVMRKRIERQSPSGTTKQTDHSPDDRNFNDVVEEWVNHMPIDDGDGDGDGDVSGMAHASEIAIDTALSALTEHNWIDQTDLKLRALVSNFPSAAFVVLRTGRIVRMNEAAIVQFNVLPDDNIDATNLFTVDGRKVSELLAHCSERVNSKAELRLVTAECANTGSPKTLAIIPAKLEGIVNPCNLVLVVENTVRAEIVVRVAKFFGLTSAEQALLQRFLAGKDLKAIAEETNRSVKTLRTQFHALMQKAGVSRQADLVGKVLSISHFLDQLNPIAKAISHPNRKRSDLLRPGRRSVEVFFAGDMDGDLVVVVPNVTMRTFPAELEESFCKRGLCVATLCRPGFGGTDPAPTGQTTRQCFACDFESLLDQLSVSRARLVAQNTGCGYAIGLARDVPNRVSDILLVSAMPPLPYLSVQNSNSKLSAAFIRARKVSPKLFRLLMHLSVRAWKMGGVQRVHGRQMAPYMPDLAFLKRAEIAEEFDECMRSRFAQDLDMIAEDFEMAISDWSDDLQFCKAPISILHGLHDQAVSVSDIRRWRDDFAELISLTEVDDAGFMLPYSHPGVFLSGISGDLVRR